MPGSYRIVRDEEVAPRFRFIPASHGPQLQNGHPFNYCELWSSVRGNTPHPVTVDTQFLAEHGNFGFQLVDSGVSRITICNQGFTTGERGDAYDADDIQNGTLNTGVPVLGEA